MTDKTPKSKATPSMHKPARKGFMHLFDAFTFSMKGLKSAWHNETAFRQEICALPILIPLALWVGQSAVEHILLITPLLLIISLELINSSIESVVDRISTEHHPLSGQAKDLGSASVFIAMLLALIIWGLILISRFSTFYTA